MNCQGQAQESKKYNLDNGVAIHGYDLVSYHTPEGPIKGKSNISHTKNNVTYWFASEANKSRFIKNPERYEPEYGGFCAYAIAKGDRVDVDPKTFKFVNDKLYLFYNFNGNNTLIDWNKKEEKLLKKADEQWEKIN